MLDPLATDLSFLELPTPVTLATLSLEVPPGPVGMEGGGLGYLQLVKVSKYMTCTVCLLSVSTPVQRYPVLTYSFWSTG